MSLELIKVGDLDSIDESRLAYNENFEVIETSLNSMFDYLNTQVGDLENLRNISSDNIVIGNSDTKFSVVSTFEARVPSTFYENTTFDSLVLRQSINPDSYNDTDNVDSNLEFNVGSSTAVPEFEYYRVSNNGSSPVIAKLWQGSIGQEITFIYESAASGDVEIVPQSGVAYKFSSSATKVILSELGQSITFCSISDGTNNPFWFIKSGNGYTLA